MSTTDPGGAPVAPSDPAAVVSLLLFVSGASSPSARAIRHVQALCEEQLPGRYLLRVIDVHLHSELTRQHAVLATPTLLRESPPPHRIKVGDFSDHRAVLAALDLDHPGAGHRHD
jgi:circadian clock protein KaiB